MITVNKTVGQCMRIGFLFSNLNDQPMEAPAKMFTSSPLENEAKCLTEVRIVFHLLLCSFYETRFSQVILAGLELVV